jgi:2-dehydro-3-deoxyglucarate aldolase/4-hydroxy-2-oxoheptanedioate aldolase
MTTATTINKTSAIAAFRAKMASGEVCIGASITLTDPHTTDALGDSVDFFWIDLEHSVMSPEALAGHLLAARARNVPALVRVTGSGTPFIKPVLDAGADGIIVPQVRSAQEVQQVVNDCRYPPWGQRGYGPRVPSNYGRDGGSAYIERANREVFVAVQIENVEALHALDEILAIQGLDSLVLGPWDLSASLGRLGEVEHPAVVAALETVIARTRAAGLFIGSGMGTDANYAAKMARRGVQWLQVGDDCGYMIMAMDQIVSSVQRQWRSDGA